ncbi:uncharacterized protein EV154DRAFT_570584 [Mucor mucedo]|uniref:uncharacterized protein n=1 Tax=Mucor mucedo TaxID=29922 RepID=UPI00221F83BA|nr:uncharacterized protein EV154DRAFT_570584 [Mucor mucedo]KAI7871938.1 hypothetical protein EV154DRAFT_570584 [Mucor mucedo]
MGKIPGTTKFRAKPETPPKLLFCDICNYETLCRNSYKVHERSQYHVQTIEERMSKKRRAQDKKRTKEIKQLNTTEARSTFIKIEPQSPDIKFFDSPIQFEHTKDDKFIQQSSQS